MATKCLNSQLNSKGHVMNLKEIEFGGLGRATWSEDAFSEAPSPTFLTTVFMEVSSVFVTPKRKYSRNSSCSSTEASPEEKRAKEASSPDVTLSSDAEKTMAAKTPVRRN